MARSTINVTLTLLRLQQEEHWNYLWAISPIQNGEFYLTFKIAE